MELLLILLVKIKANLEPTLNSFKIALTMAENKNKQ
jgi:hypothetical protein